VAVENITQAYAWRHWQPHQAHPAASFAAAAWHMQFLTVTAAGSRACLLADSVSTSSAVCVQDSSVGPGPLQHQPNVRRGEMDLHGVRIG